MVVEFVKSNGIELVILEPAHGCPAPFTSFRTLAEVFPLLFGLFTTVVPPPSNASNVMLVRLPDSKVKGNTDTDGDL